MKKFRAALLATACLTAAPGMASAQEAPPPETAQAESEGIEDIVVTAQRRQERLQEVPIAATAFSSESLDALGITDVALIQTQTPNLVIKSQFGSTNPNTFLRGVGANDFNENASPAVGIYVDDVYLSAPAGQLAQLYDVQRVEVLRGPQGTLYGKNTTAGAINVLSRQPVFEEEGYARLGLGRFNQLDLEGAINIPLTETLALRAAGASQRRDGWIYNAFNGDDVNAIDIQAGRIQLLWEPEGPHSVLFNLNGSYNRSDKFQGEAVGLSPTGTNIQGFREPNDGIDRASYNNAGEIDAAQFGGFLRYDYQADVFSFASITGYNSTRQQIQLDTDQSPFRLIESNRRSTSWQWSQEFRVTSDFEGPFNGVAGVYYFTEAVKNVTSFFFGGADPTVFTTTVLRPRYRQETTGYAAYAQGTYEVTDQLSLTLGVRGTYEEKAFDLVSNRETPGQLSPAVTLPGAVITPVLPFSSRTADYDNVSGRFAVDYQLTEDFLVYGSVSQGFRAGGFNGGANASPLQLNAVEPETLIAYEAGIKSDWLDGRLRANITAFRYDYSDLQVTQFVTLPGAGATGGLVLTVDNAANAEVQGLEFEFQVRPVDQFEAGLNLAFLESEYQDYIIARGTPSARDLSGNRLVGAPEMDASGYLQYTQPVPLGDLIFRLDGTHKGSVWFDADQRVAVAREVPSYTVFNASVSLNADDWTFRIWSRNIADEEYVVEAVDVRAQQFRQVYYGDPRTFGAELTYRW